MKNIFFLIALHFSVLVFSQKDEGFINWSEDKRLKWEDFKAAPQKIGDVAALTATHLGFSYNVVNGKISYKIECRFETNRSWGMVKNNWILNHEQGHFDIAEIYSRKLFKAISAYQFSKTTFQKDLDTIYKKLVDEKDQYQQLYDLETNYSRNKSEQEEWLIKIKNDLTALNSWADYK